ncbi:hypothetical protein DERP_013577 [Dermatophagoides pteronyssinus]|uniref:Uncharacterized protein n=1 Tax=Dermatophagoides pteronyssinus TaxID=6956 RepID=A0ABQ8J5E9_DERPT|nr:hypothetical protein DERP_013577 [Dermatophagoides pteronyssinus]
MNDHCSIKFLQTNKQKHYDDDLPQLMIGQWHLQWTIYFLYQAGNNNIRFSLSLIKNHNNNLEPIQRFEVNSKKR